MCRGLEIREDFLEEVVPELAKMTIKFDDLNARRWQSKKRARL